MASLLDRSLQDVRRNAAPVFGSRRPPAAAIPTGPAVQATQSSSEGKWAHDMYSAQTAASAASSGANHNGATGNIPRSTHVLITNLHYDVSERELETLFSQVGTIKIGPLIKFDLSGRARDGLAFLSYSSEAEAARAIEEFNGAPAKGEKITIKTVNILPKWVQKVAKVDERGRKPSSAPSLLGRIQVDHTDRLLGGPPQGRNGNVGSRGFNAPRGPSAGIASRGAARGRGFSRGSARGGRGGPPGGGAGRGKSAPNQADLDKELEAFMKPADDTKDVEMKAE